MGLLTEPARVAVGVSSMPNTSVGVLVVGDVSLEVNELDLEWHNVYDGDTYVCTQLRVSALALVHTDELNSPMSNQGMNIGKFIHAILSQSYTVSNPLSSVSKPHTEVVESFINMDASEAVPSSTIKDTNIGFEYTRAAGMQGRPLNGNRFDATTKSSVICIPPANFAVLYKPSVMSGLAIGNQSTSHHPVPAFSSCGVNIPGWCMFQPIEVELVSLDSNIGHDISALRVVVSVYFNMSSITSGTVLPFEPAYHKWSVSSTWTVGHKPRIIVNGRLVRKLMIAGAPSLWEWLPRTMPGMHLVQLDTSSDHDGKVTTYTAVYELDFVLPIFVSDNDWFLTPMMAKTAFSMAYYTVHETAETVVQGGLALEYAYETQLARASTEADMTNAMMQNIYGLLKNVIATATNIVGQTANLASATAKTILTGGLFGAGEAAQAGASIAGGMANTLVDIASTKAHQQRLQVNRFVSHMSLDRSALSSMANTVVRTAIVEVYGYPGTLVDSLQVAAFTIAKQIYMGWIVMALNPVQRFGWLVRNVLQYQSATNLVKSVLTNGRGLLNSTGAGIFSGNTIGIVGDLLSGLLTAAGTGLGNLLGIPNVEWMRTYQPVNIRLDTFQTGWEELMDKWLGLLGMPEAYSLPRRFPGFLLLGRMGADASTFTNEEKMTTAMKTAQLSVDDALSVLLATMGIHKVQTMVSVDHTIPMVRLQLSVVFKSLEYSGNTALHSVWRVFGPYYQIYATDGNTDTNSNMPSISTMVPAILPIMSAEAFNNYLQNIPTKGGFGTTISWGPNREGPQRVFSSAKANLATFAHVFYDVGMAVGDEQRRAKVVLGKHIIDQGFASSIYAHGGSVGTGFITPTITPAYNRPGLEGVYYASGLGAGVAMDYLYILAGLFGVPRSGMDFKHPPDNSGELVGFRNNWV
jgi:hypothetical protein